VQNDYQLESYEIGAILIDKARLYAAGAALVATAGLFAFFKLTLTGKAIRACADNYLGARVVGLDVKHLYALTFGLGSACLAVAGCAMVLLVEVTPSLGPAYTLLAFVIVIVGGLGSMGGALLGGILIGVSEALAGLLIAPSAKSMVSFGLLILVLLFRPQGLLGRRP
jgi:branched-chain amino acid transport system permease protein